MQDPSLPHVNRFLPPMRTRRLALIFILCTATLFSGILFWKRSLGMPEILWMLENKRSLLLQWRSSLGPWAPALFVLLQALQVMVAPIPGEATGFMGGYLFGGFSGFVYSMVGLTLGSFLNFCLGRWLGAEFCSKIIPSRIQKNLQFIQYQERCFLILMLYLIPGFPKDFLCYFLGMTSITPSTFLAATAVGRAPSTWLLAAQGSQLAQGHYPAFWALIGGSVLLLLIVYACRRSIYDWMRRKSSMDTSPS
jgi:uncharacterized membrane protein YdjX (TVP38/TMEM64 family)